MSMDGPNVNLKLLEMIQSDSRQNLQLTLMDIGTCNLHLVHGAFRDGAVATGWDIERFLTCLYQLFNETPAHREDFQSETGCEMFPLKMCCHQWVENVPVCEQVQLLLPHIRKYLQSIAFGKFAKPNTVSFARFNTAVLMIPCLMPN
jgi:hypothetical protein